MNKEMITTASELSYALLLLATSAIPGIILFRYASYSCEFYWPTYARANLGMIVGCLSAAVVSSILYVLTIVSPFVIRGDLMDTDTHYRAFGAYCALCSFWWLLFAVQFASRLVFRKGYVQAAFSIYAMTYIACVLLTRGGVSAIETVSYAYDNINEVLALDKQRIIKAGSKYFAEKILGAVFWCSIAYVSGRYVEEIVFFRRYEQLADRFSIAFYMGGMRMIIRSFLLLAVGSIGLMILKIDPVALALFSGIAGAALSIVFRNLLRDVFSGAMLTLDNSIKRGDFIRIADGPSGEVWRIGPSRTVIITRDNVDVLIPNNMLAESRIENMTRTESQVRLNFVFGVGLDADLERVRKHVLYACRRVPHVALVVGRAPALYYLGPRGGRHEFDLRFWVAEPRLGIERLRSDVAYAVFDELKKEGIPYPSS